MGETKKIKRKRKMDQEMEDENSVVKIKKKKKKKTKNKRPCYDKLCDKTNDGEDDLSNKYTEIKIKPPSLFNCACPIKMKAKSNKRENSTVNCRFHIDKIKSIDVFRTDKGQKSSEFINNNDHVLTDKSQKSDQEDMFHFTGKSNSDDVINVDEKDSTKPKKNIEVRLIVE